MNNTKNGGGGDGGGFNGAVSSPNPNRGEVNFNDAPGGSPSVCTGQMNPTAFKSQFAGMMSDMPNNPLNFISTADNPQNFMSMMSSFCQTANSGGVGGNTGPLSSPPGNDGSDPQGMNPAMAQMLRKRPNEDVGNERSAKRCNSGPSGASEIFTINNANESLSAKEEDVLPPSKEGIKFYSRNDVLSGRGGGTNVHPGNSRFRDLINANRRAYLKARKNDKPAISRAIVRTIREMNGRFLKKDEKVGLWFEIGDVGAREKTSQALRQRAPEMRKILFEEEQRQQQQRQQMMMMQLMEKGSMGGQGDMGGTLSQMGPMGMQFQNSGGTLSQMGPLGGMGGMGPMSGMGGMGPMGDQEGIRGNFAASSLGSGNQGGPNGGNINELSSSLLTDYNMPHQMNRLAQEKNMILQRLAMPGLNTQSPNSTQNNIDNMMTQTLLQQGMKPVIPRGA